MPRSNRNLGETTLPRRKSSGHPMACHDRLPKALRLWIAQAALPWSADSCLRIWNKALRDGSSVEDALERLSRAERAMLERDATGLLRPRARAPLKRAARVRERA